MLINMETNSGGGGGTSMSPEIATIHYGSGYNYGTLVKYNDGVPTVINRASTSSTPIEGDYLIVDQATFKIKAKVAVKCLVTTGSGQVSIQDYAANAEIINSSTATDNVVVVIPS